MLTREQLIAKLYTGVHRVPQADGNELLRPLNRKVAATKKQLKDAMESLKQRLKAKEFKKNSAEAKAFREETIAPLESILAMAEVERSEAAQAGATPDLTTALGPHLKVKASALAQLAAKASMCRPDQRREADFFAAFGCETIVDKDGTTLEPTRFSKQNGNSGKNMLIDIAVLMQRVTEQQLVESLFEPWRYQDDKYSLGWDPRDVRPYAYQADDPASGSVTMHGANLLAYEALTLFPAVPRGGRLITTGTTGTRRGGTGEFFTWPVWAAFLPSSVVKSLVAHPLLVDFEPDHRTLLAMGVNEVFRAQHVTVGKSQRFGAARAV
jgi:hypothetical protein